MKKSTTAYEEPKILVHSLATEHSVCTWSGQGEITDDKWNDLFDEE